MIDKGKDLLKCYKFFELESRGFSFFAAIALILRDEPSCNIDIISYHVT